ncbi:MAG: bifunctional demethylmenaquinone methyltransferase/2-methoxy-6-polyprenyl-1,4-benzoquinol methylase UbiE [Planctomycetota bacterium]|mgnify:FL=1
MPQSQHEAPPARAPEWSSKELADPHHHAQKATKVRGMFSAIAGSYDLNNRLHSLWRDQAWRRAAVRTAAVKPGDHVLDMACGTGDLTELFARSAAARVVGGDFTPAMLEIARTKQPRNLSPEHAAKVSYIEADAMNLEFADASFDVLSIAFGIRNVLDPARALREFARVLKPGGRLVILEFDRPGWFPMNWFHDLYCGWIMPRTATLISGDRSGAYKYLPRSVGTFMSRGQLSDLMGQSGFREVSSRGLSLGICVCYRGVRAT